MHFRAWALQRSIHPPLVRGEGDHPKGGGGGGANASGPIPNSGLSGESGADPSTLLRRVPLPASGEDYVIVTPSAASAWARTAL